MSENKNKKFIKPSLVLSQTEIMKKSIRLRGIISRISTHNIINSKFISKHIKHNYKQKCSYSNIKSYVINLVEQLAKDCCNGCKFYDHIYYGYNGYMMRPKDIYNYVKTYESREMNPVEIYSDKLEEYDGRMIKPLEIINMLCDKKIFDQDKNFQRELEIIFNKELKLNKLKPSISLNLSLVDKLNIDNPNFFDEVSKMEQIEQSLTLALKSFGQSKTNQPNF